MSLAGPSSSGQMREWGEWDNNVYLLLSLCLIGDPPVLSSRPEGAWQGVNAQGSAGPPERGHLRLSPPPPHHNPPNNISPGIHRDSPASPRAQGHASPSISGNSQAPKMPGHL